MENFKGGVLLQQFFRTFVTNWRQWEWARRKAARLKGCMLIMLCFLAIAMTIPPEAAPVQATLSTLSGLTVALDPGHGGYDGGARAHDSGRWEKDLTLEIALEVERALLARGADVVLTRREDLCLAQEGSGKARKRADLQARRDLAEKAGADVLISIHLNEYRSRSESGPQVFYQKDGDDGRLLAGALQEALIAGLKPAKERRAMAGDYYVLRGKLPSVLLECGFLSNAAEEKLLLNAQYQRRIAQAVADGLETWRELRERTL